MRIPLRLKAVLAGGTLPAMVPEVEGPAEVVARGEAGLALVERGPDTALVEGEEESALSVSTPSRCRAHPHSGRVLFP